MAWCGDSVKPPLVYKYSVKITSEDNRTIEGKGIGRELIDMVYRKYSHNFGGIKYVYDGEKALYTAVRLPHDRLEFTVVSEKASEKSEYGTTRSSLQSTMFTVELSYVAEIPLKSNALEVADVDKTQAKMGCLLVRQPFFHDESSNFADVGARVIGVRGFHSSFDGLSLNTEVYRKMIKTPGPVIDILMAKHGVLYRQILSKQVAKSMEEDADLPSSLVASQSGHASNGISDVKTSEAPKEKPIIMTEQPEISASAKAPHVFVTTTVKNPLGAKKTGKSGGLGARKLTTKVLIANLRKNSCPHLYCNIYFQFFMLLECTVLNQVYLINAAK